MNLTLAAFFQECGASLAFLLLLPPAGFAVAWWLNPHQFRARSLREQLLWSVALSAPFTLVLANVAGRVLPPPAILAILLLLDACGFLLCLRYRTQRWRSLIRDPQCRVIFALLLLAILYTALAALPVRWHGGLYEPVASSDWEIRLPLVRAAMQDGVPPRNPFFTLHGQSPTMRYYYYWYELCALPGRLLGASARSLLVASSIYAMLVMVSTLFLCLKYMTASHVTLYRRCLWMLCSCLVLGLDVIPSLLGLAVWRVRLRPEIEWWLEDRMPGLPSAIMFGPHHVAGIACGLLSLLAISLLALEDGSFSLSSVARYGSLIALCFAALVGTSSFVTLFFAVACTVLFLDQLRRGDRRVPAALLFAAVLSLAVSLPYLHELTAKTVKTEGNSAGKHALKLQLREDVQGQLHLFVALKRLHLPHPSGPIRFLPRLLIVLLYCVCQFGFFLFIVALQFRKSFRGGSPMQIGTRALWMLAISTFVFYLFISSSPIQNVNDLGVHAGLLLRVICILWAAGIIPETLDARRLEPRASSPQLAFGIASACFVLGLMMCLWEAVGDRIYLVLLDHGDVPAALPFPAGKGLAHFYESMYDAQTAIARQLPVTAVVQGNPVSRYGLIFRLYQERRQAAGDVSCEGSFGGSPEVCQSFLPGILGLFGVHERPSGGKPPAPILSSDRTPAAFSSVCTQDGLAAVVASRADPAWYDHASWVWHGRVVFADDTVRVIACPVA